MAFVVVWVGVSVGSIKRYGDGRATLVGGEAVMS